MAETSESVMESTPIFEDEHEAFAASRSSQYVYIPPRDHYFPYLDQHANTLEGDVTLPLVILGGEGSGKSALLANWVAKRRKTKHRDEFLFQHFVGCSAKSCQLSHTLFRLETALKEFFQLREMEVPDSEDRLRWSLNRFLEAAAKKHSPGRIVIIIDGVNNLKGEGVPDGSLHWLPTELHPCVRFIVSTVEFERAVPKSKDDVPQHRTAIELARRQSPLLKMEPLRMEPLSGSTRQKIITDFSSKYPDLDLQEAQFNRIVTAPAAAQPLFLRSLLQSLRLGMAMTSSTIDTLLDTFLHCSTAFELTVKTLSQCSLNVFKGESDLLGKVFSVLYVSRNGLSEEEIWGLIEMVSQTVPNENIRSTLYAIVREFCMVVNGLYSFSHETYYEVVYENFICSNESLIRWHHLMAKFFGQLPPCDRKLECLPYHLEVAGCWTKVKNCLTDIAMFRLWWTPKFKKDFIKLWASLTARPERKTQQSDAEELPTSTGEVQTQSRPVYDIVEEYAKSLDEYRDAIEPKDEELSETILQIGDFLIEFATLGHELAADVPASIHPIIPSEDLCSLGVPHIREDEGGSYLLTPSWEPSDDGKKAIQDAPTKPKEDLPVRTMYFFNRWMWMQFPYIAVGNCGTRYFKGKDVRQAQLEGSAGGRTKKFGESMTSLDRPSSEARLLRVPLIRPQTRVLSASASTFGLPEIKFNRKAARTMRRVVGDDLSDPDVAADKVTRRLVALQDEIQSLREEYDFISGQKNTLAKRLDSVKLHHRELLLLDGEGKDYEKELSDVIQRDEELVKKMARKKTINMNLQRVILMCDRHPPDNPAVISDVENKLKQDAFLIKEIKSRLYEQEFERQSHIASFRRMKALVQEGRDMYTKLLDYRYGMKRYIQNQNAEDARVIQQRISKQSTNKGLSQSAHKMGSVEGEVVEGSGRESKADTWQQTWQIISQRTGITDPDIFFQRQNNGGKLVDQMKTLKQVSETRLKSLKQDAANMETDLEKLRYEASSTGGQSRDAYVRQNELAKMQQRMRREKEKTESAEQLQQQVTAGILHLCELLKIPVRGEDAALVDVFHDIESMLEKYLEEQDKGTASNTAETPGFGRASPDSHHRNTEMDFLTSKLDMPRTRIAAKLPSRAVDNGMPSERESEEDEMDEEGMWDRKYAKGQAQKSIKDNLRKAAKQSKNELMMSSTM
eukprot:CAMPEP_0182421964 /NCGR_PEP_ID=MMETSP1167-20130531/7553_1 /TAXON_ID=2988 /ORGANISM="Mallomonas Sp, Strain CCMP3275" /LENGTH=1186 /DNA_ID=CAMNT_0024599637 /DNA_START=36 /DNA_END=3596 /DNA_ORIENTATION=+